MHKLRSMGIFVALCGAFCLVIAVDKYYSAVRTAEVTAHAIATQVEGFQLESVGIPTEAIVCGFFGVMLLVGGGTCIIRSFGSPSSEESSQGLLD